MTNRTLHRLLTERPQAVFWAFVAMQILVWTAVPSLTYSNVPLDVIEGLTWGQAWQWGYQKHPPLQAWLLQATAWMFGKQEWAFFLLSQLTVAVTYWAVWKLSSRIVGRTGALISVLLLPGVYYFTYPTPEFNPNLLQMPFWALAGFLFYRALVSGAISDWLMLGIASALLMYTKYSGFVLFVPLLAFLLIEPTARTRLRAPGPYLALLVGLVLYLPHLSWLRDSEFLPFAYALERAGDAQSWLDHILYPARFAGAQMLDHLAMLVVILLGRGFFLGRESGVTESGVPAIDTLTTFDKRFVYALALGPFLLALIISALFGYKLRSMWGAPMFCFSGLLAVLVLRPVLNTERLKAVAMTWCALFILVAAAKAAVVLSGPYVTNQASRAHYPGAAAADALTRAWHEATGQQLRFVVGTTWVAGNLAFYSEDGPAVYIDANPKASPWIDDSKINEFGALIVWRADRQGDRVPNQLAAGFPSAVVQQPMSFAWQTGAKIAPVRLGWAVVRPDQGAAPKQK